MINVISIITFIIIIITIIINIGNTIVKYGSHRLA